ncbi:MAG: hypothetical protein ACR2P2_15645, partial [Nakamurella sp.]
AARLTGWRIDIRSDAQSAADGDESAHISEAVHDEHPTENPADGQHDQQAGGDTAQQADAQVAGDGSTPGTGS